MAGEQMLILQMLEDGKITAEQAVGLLEAIGLRQAEAAEERQAASSPAAQIREEERRARQAVREEAARARAQARQARTEAKAETKGQYREDSSAQRGKSWNALGLLLGGSKEFSFTRELNGKFEAASPSIRLQNTNGRIQLGPSSDDYWHLRLRIRVRANDETSAQTLADKLVQVNSDGGTLTVQAQQMFGQNASVAIELLLPQHDYKELSVGTTNGSIQLEEMTATNMAIKTVNGKVKGEQLQADTLQASSVNGSVTLDGAIAKVQAKAGNGRLNVAVTEMMDTELDLRAVNGSIAVELAEGQQVVYELEVASTAGSIKHDLPRLVVQEEQKRPGRRKLIAASPPPEGEHYRQQVKANTVSGSIKINT